MEANVRKNKIVLAFLMVAIVLVVTFAIGSILYGQEAEAAPKPGLTNCVNHNPVKTLISSATCQSAARYQNICDECGLASGAAYTSGSKVSCSYSWTTTRSATCSTAGSKKGTCKWCGGTKTQSIPATGIHQTAHGTIKAATCTAAGSEGTKCANCSYTANVTSVPALGHTGGSATCTAAAKCTRCGSSYGSSLGHNSYGSIKAEAATCTSSGVVGGTYCTRCNSGKAAAERTIAALGHNSSGSVTAKAATCTSSGVAGGTYCTRCNNGYSAASKTIAALGHTGGTATCTLQKLCTRCRTRYGSTAPHQTTYGTIKAPTCTASGTQGTSCANCSYTANVTTVAALGHTGGTATCTSKKLCTRCSTRYGDTAPHQVTYGTIKAATCTARGTEGTSCANCSYTANVVETPALGHTGGTATCTAAAKCSRCGTSYGSSLGHNTYGSIKAEAATCTSSGVVGGTYCTRCNNGKAAAERTIAALGHNSSGSIAAKAATCTASGVVGGTYCTRCNNGYSAAAKTIAALGHTGGTATCTLQKLCTRCRTRYGDTTPHQVAHGTIKAATCTAKGTEGTKCANCSYTANVVETPALGHTGGTATCTLQKLCTRCSTRYGDTAPHQVAHGTIKAATCTAKGTEGTKCANCSYTANVVETPALGHKYGNYTTIVAATCVVDGSKRGTCVRSGCSATDTQPIIASGHVWGDDWAVGKAATCTADGYYNDYCFTCGDTQRGSVIKATGHKYSWTTIIATTCVRAGKKTGTCSCGATTEKIEPATGIHTVTDGVISAPTCTKDGSYGAMCAHCTYTNPTMILTATGHDYSGGWVVTEDSTCSKIGSKYQQCKTCGHKDEAIVDYKPHQVSIDNYWVRKPTCYQVGIIATKCANCDYYYNEQTTSKSSHVMEAWVIDQQATCIRDGYKHRVCENYDKCNYREGQTITSPGHLWEKDYRIALAATCTSDGYYVNRCARCGTEERGTTIISPGHQWTPWTVTQKGTCVRDEIQGRTCSVCSETQSKTTIKAPGHIMEKDYRVGLAATCIEDGYYYDRCKTCGMETRGNIIPKSTTHPWGKWVVTQPGTCVRDKIETRECTYCSKTETRTTKTNGHIWEDNHHVELAPTCTATGYYNDRCKTCGLERRGDTISMIDHSTTLIDHYNGTCMSKETWKYECTVCKGIVYTYGEYNKNVHEMNALQEVQPTCTAAGAIYEYCSNCDLRFNKQKDLPALGHNYKYPCSDSCDRTFNGQRCNAVNPDRQEHKFVHQTKGTEHFYTCSWCGYQRKYVDPDGSLVLYGVRQWRSTFDIDSPYWDVLYPSDWMGTQMVRHEAGPAYKEGYQYDDLPNNDEFIVLDGDGDFTLFGDEAILPVTFTSNGRTFRGVRIAMFNGMSGCHEYSWTHQIVQLSYTSLTPNCGPENYRDKTVVAETNGLIGHNHPIGTYGYPTWNTSYATMDFGNGVAVTPTVYEFITNNTVQLEASYTVEIYRQKQNVSMSGNFTTDKNAGRYEYFTSSTVTVPLKTLNTVMYPVYSGYTLTNVSGAQNVTTNANGDKVIQVYADGSNVVVKLYYNKEAGPLTFNSLGGSSVSGGEIVYNDNLGYTITGTVNGALPTPTRAGYKFLGWTRSKVQGAKDYVTGSSYMNSINDITNGLTLYAQWECAHTTKTAWQATTKGSCTTEGLKYRNCANASCDYALRNNLPLGTKYTEEAVIPARQHAWSGEWTYDNQAHWHVCTNGETDFYTACVSFTDKSTHTLTIIDEASCTENGIGGCIHCDYRYTIEAPGHLWSSSWTTDETHHWKACTRVNCPGDGTYQPARNELAQHNWTITTAPDCLNNGEATCSTCNRTTTDIDSVQPTGHNWSASWSTDATSHWKACTNSNCPGDGTYKPARNEFDEHTWTVTTEPNCTTDGVATCLTCGLTTTNTVTVPDIKHTGHNWSDWQYTCGESWCDSASCQHYKQCLNANCPGNPGGTPAINDKADHTWIYASNSDRPTCTSDGVQTCSTCGHVRVVSHTGHTWSSTWQHDEYEHWHKCSTCGETCYYACCNTHACTQHPSGDYHYAHKWTITTHPTCTTTGTRECDICGRTETLDATGHDFSGSWDASNAQGHWHICNNTNLNNGTKCTATDGPFAHNEYAAGEENACFKCADCGYTTDGEHRYSYPCDSDCNDCGYVRTAHHHSVPASNPDAWTCEVCSYCGITTDWEHEYDYACDAICNNCGFVRDADHYEVTANNPNESKCTECYYCGITMQSAHTYSYTCDTTCNICGYVRYAEHKWTVLESHGGTCIRPSYYKQQCDYCGTIEEGTGTVGSIHEGEFLPVSEADACYRWNCCGKTDPNHDMREHTLTSSTCITNGTTEYRCSKCNYTISGRILPLDSTRHEGNAVYGGEQLNHTYWSCCGMIISATHHMERLSTKTAATCIDPGTSIYRCICGYWEEVEDIPALGHLPVNGTGYREPTCESTGETGYGYCSRCNVELSSSEIIPALGHNFIGDAISAGNNTHYFKCVRFDQCGAYGVGTTKNQKMTCTGGTATCTEKATCDICGAEYGTALGHSFTGAFESFNDSEHWHICDRINCNAFSTREAHIITTREIPVSNAAPGYKHDTCECGYERKYDYTYRLIIDLDGGEWNPSGRPATQLIFDGKTGETVTLPNPTKLNHKFDGWSLSGGGTISGTTYTFGTSHGNATALWLNMFYLDLNGSLNGENFSSLKHSDGFIFGTADIYVNGEKVADDVTDYYTMHVYGSSYKIVVTAKPGYNFNGNDTVTLTGTIGAADVGVYPQATSNTYKITIDLNPSATTNAVYTGSNPITGTWDERTSVRSNVTIPNPTMPGYEFTGWTITANGNELNSGVMGTQFKNLTSVLNGNVTFTATWKAIEVQYKVHHYLMNTDGKTYALKESETFYKYADVTHTIADDANSYDGFTYANGKVFQTGGTEGSVVPTVVIDADGTLNINLYYIRNQYTLTIDPNGGVWNGSTNEQTFKQYHGTTLAIPDPTRTGYTFTGWTLKGPGSYANGTYTFGIGDAELEAQWTPNVYNIVYDLNDISGTQTPKFGTKHPATGTYDAWVYIDNPSMVGYEFMGWEITGMDGVTHFYGNDTENCNTTTANSVSSTKATVFKNLTSLTAKDGGTVTFKALWKAHTYKIVYDLNDVSPSQDPVHSRKPTSATFDQTFTTEPASMTGYKFVGWTITGMDGVTHFIGANSTDGETIAGITDTTFMNLTSVNDGKVTFTAMWEPNTYTVTLNPGNGRVNPATITVTYDQQYGTLPTPVRIGYDFTGWYNAETNGTKITDATSVTTPENHTLYAGWQRSTYTITYVLNGGYYDGNSTITQQYLSGTSITLITPQAPAGKTFVGWFTSYNNSTGMYSGGIGMGGDTYMLTESITVYACYVDKHDLGITVNDIYGEIKVGSQFMTSATIVNNNLMSIIPTDNLKVVMKVYVNGVVNPSMTQVFTNQIVPGKGTQLVSAVINTSTWSNSNTYQIEWSIDTSDMDLYTEEVSTNNVSKTISFKPGQYRTITNTERPGYSTTRPGSYQNLTAPSTSTTRYEWTYWTWSNGGFVKRNSADQLDITLLLKPENESGLRDYTTPAFKYLHDYTTRSGYGLSIHTYFCTGCGKALGNATTCGSCRTSGVTSNVQANTTIGKLEAVMTFPEFNYSTANNNCAVLSADKVGNMYTLTLPMYADYNSSDVNDKFAHYTPMWLPDGQYTPVTYISGLWTPFGELTATVRQGQHSNSASDMNRLHIWSNAIILDGSLYDDLYGN